MNNADIAIAYRALELAEIQMSQCVRLLEGDEEFTAALNEIRKAINIFEPLEAFDSAGRG